VVSRIDWLLEHSERTTADLDVVWSFMTKVNNWSDPPAQFEMDGPFQAGACGRTTFPDREPTPWRIANVRPRESYVIALDLPGAVCLCQWSFTELPSGGAQITQRIGVAGNEAAQHAEGVRAGFQPTIEEGMKRIARLLNEAAERINGDER